MDSTLKNLIREVFMRNGFTVKAGKDDLADYVYAAAYDLLQTMPAVQGEPVAWSGWGCQYPGKMPRLYGERRIAELNCDWENGDQVLHFTAAPQPAEQKPAPDMPGLTEALRQYQHNDGCGLMFGYDKLLVDRHVARLVEALKWLRGAINCTPENDKHRSGAWISTKHPRIRQIDEMLVAYHKQGGEA